MKRTHLHGAIIGTSYDNNTRVKVFDPHWWQLWRYIDLIKWCIKYKTEPHVLVMPFIEIGEVLKLVVVPVNE